MVIENQFTSKMFQPSLNKSKYMFNKLNKLYSEFMLNTCVWLLFSTTSFDMLKYLFMFDHGVKSVTIPCVPTSYAGRVRKWWILFVAV